MATLTATARTTAAELGRRVYAAWEAGIIPKRYEDEDQGLPHPKQLQFLCLPQLEALYGGAAGGGKSDALLMGASLYWDTPGYSAIIFRRTHTDLAQPGALLDRSHEWWTGKAAWDGTNKIWRFPSGAKIALAYMAGPSDHFRYQGAEYQYIGFDELTQFNEQQFRYVGLSRLRRLTTRGIPMRLRSASNPGGTGHVWVKKRYVDPGHPDRPFVPALIQDNPSLDQASYIRALELLHPTTRDQLLSGNWDARDPGDYFRLEWVGPLLTEPMPSDECLRIRWWDLAATEKDTDPKKQEASARTAGVRLAKHMTGVYVIEHATAFRLTPGRRDRRIIQQAKLDGFDVLVGVEVEPGSGGIAQAETLQRKLRRLGYRVILERATGDKMHRADPFASELEKGYQCGWGWDEESKCVRGVRLVAGPWTQDYVDEVGGFPEDELKDQMDASSGAFNYLRTRYAGGRNPLGEPARKPEEARDGFLPEEDELDEDPLRPRKRWHRDSGGGRIRKPY